MPDEQKNFLFAIALSLLVIVAWELFYTPSSQPSVNKTITNKTGLSGQTQKAITAQKQLPNQSSYFRQEGSKGEKLKIKTDRVKGSLQKRGTLFNALSLSDYRQSLDENAPPVELLQPKQFDVSFGWSSLDGDIINADTNWQTKDKRLSSNKKIVFTHQDKKTGLFFEREVSIDENYMFQVKDSIVNQGQTSQQISAWARARRKNHPEGSGFYLLHEGLIGFFSDDGLEEIDYDDLEDETEIKFQSQEGWLGFTDKYWAVVLIPNQAYAFQAMFQHQPIGAGADAVWITQYISQGLVLKPNEKINFTQHFFAGAKETSLIDSYEKNLPVKRFDLMIDWGWFFFMTKPFFLLLDFFSKFSGNFGVAILIVTVLVKLVFFPLANKSYETMAVMRKVQPELERVRARHKGDMMAQNREIAELWKKHEVKPLMGCLPMLLQIPVFFALYKVLFVTIEMRHAPFFGWINDLSAADPLSLFNLFGLLPIPLPDFLIIGIWPLLMGATMFVQMRLNPPPPDPIQRKVFAWAPLVIMLLLARFPAGLVIYATWNTVLSALQQGFIMKRQGVKIDLLANLGIKNEPKQE